ncbi:hypothetical protein NW754_003531 [Fusarium falciforme]|uniref:Uncharacterized protein n=1 Tax=Fusarium falciforme TaxID=195108 RepID=A0A9W8RD72_9HYPO|nr:Hypothetical protein NCS54_00305700 [Fusarium falciforme]KAJ4160407.1 hypothetical protein NW754_003531 [Fusarium falciforme]KAJ4189530.1 hypothetical protein NW767_011551 [Fusarium falciforme]KAJ4192525.1 hypothetical protein NW755_003677 [Fusarium falciforme]KAJ4250305.1 hypothetical protein NW757_007138 [Fusarium falciforme]WAO85808.1 Hypothetical protein NCS54_00305700 [Fusarium falciforme]
MAAKGQTTEAAYQSLPRDDPSAALLHPEEREEEERKPSVSITFSPILLLRFVVIALGITATVFICMPWYHDGLAAFFGIWSIMLILWNSYHLISGLIYCVCCGKKGGNNVVDITLGSFFCSFGFVSAIQLGSPQTKSILVKLRPYLINLVDLGFGGFFIIPGVIALTSGVWYYDDNVGGLCITLSTLEFIIAFLSLFSIFRKAKLVLYKAEEHDKPAYTIPELYRDDTSEPRASTSSEV